MKVIIGETCCEVIHAVTGMNIRCTGEMCPAYDRARLLCDVGERPTRPQWNGRIVIDPIPGFQTSDGEFRHMYVRYE